MEFDQGFDAPGQSRDKSGERDAGDPYANDSPIPKGGSQGKQAERTDKALGDKDSEASLRYEHHAFLRMQAKRDKMYKNDQKVSEEDNPDEAGDDYNRWRSKQIKASLAANVDSHATDHSTIMTNGMHAEKALAYDLAIGCCEIPANNLRVARYAADWRFLEALKDEDINKVFSEYFLSGKFRSKSPYDWANDSPNGEGSMPAKIFDERQSRPRQKQEPAQ